MVEEQIPLGLLLHLSTNFWNDAEVPVTEPWGPDEPFHSPRLRCDDSLWASVTQGLADVGGCFVVVDLGDGVRYDSHPEIAVEGAWSTGRLRDELARLRDLGLEPLPKLNFSTSHDAWMGEMARRVSTPEYYRFCEDLIAEVADLFDGPRLFHIGMDEETLQHQRTYPHVVLRQFSLWWNDLDFYVDRVETAGARAWMWSDYAWHHPDFFARVSPRIVQSNWHYAPNFHGGREDGRPHEIAGGIHPESYLTYLDLADAGLDQIPTGSTWSDLTNFEETVRFCQDRIDPATVLGCLQTTWKNLLPQYAEVHDASLAAIRRAIDLTVTGRTAPAPG